MSLRIRPLSKWSPGKPCQRLPMLGHRVGLMTLEGSGPLEAEPPVLPGGLWSQKRPD